MAQQIGMVTHYYGKPHAAVIDLTAPLNVGETVTFEHGDTHVTQVAQSIQIDHVPIDAAKPGDSIGLQVAHSLKPGTIVYRP